MRRWPILILLFTLAAASPVAAERPASGPIVHEPIPADPREDLELSALLGGDLPPAIKTQHGLVPAPDPNREISNSERSYESTPRGDVPDSTFRPDRDTRRPDVLPYDDPFSPSTAPFKRLSAFDTIDASYTLKVSDSRLVPLAVSGLPSPGADDEHFFGDMVVEVAPKSKVRIPSVGPGARVLRARAGIGAQDVGFRLFHDGADNWFIEGDRAARVRFVVELAIARAAFGGDFGNPSWSELPITAALPTPVRLAAKEVAQKIGVSRKMSPHDNVTKLVEYFRGFTDSDEPPPVARDIYLDLALSKKGVCRHRSFAFMVTALSLGIPTRMIVNEAHAWVEVHNGRLWQRIDLGGAGRMLDEPLASNVPYDPPQDPFAWPQGSTRGQDLGDRARRAQQNDAGAPSNGPDATSTADAASPNSIDDARTSRDPEPGDERPTSTITMTLESFEAKRGTPLRMRGQVSANGEFCDHLAIQIYLRRHDSRGRVEEIPIGELATDEHGAYDGALVIPTRVQLGDYDLGARTLGNARCGSGQLW
ncbi:MAG: transglutaminase-like domain-containing protein [Polyangiaceae bacterium]|nr:transglutaminase-like domain-containing protein [Polyangiaceae bacterium]